MKTVSRLFVIALIATFGVACNQGTDEQTDEPQDSAAVVEEVVTEEPAAEEAVTEEPATEDTAATDEEVPEEVTE
ncbi:MAG: hypothetical protein ACE5DN_03370 [Flavobacteriales bacterium]